MKKQIKQTIKEYEVRIEKLFETKYEPYSNMESKGINEEKVNNFSEFINKLKKILDLEKPKTREPKR